MSKLTLNRPTTWLTAKILTYHYNALVDAQIAAELISYLQTDHHQFATQHTVSQQRAEELIKTLEKTTGLSSPVAIAGLAYTVYYANGLANHLYARLLTGLLFTPHKKQVVKFVHRYQQQLQVQAGFTTHYLFTEFSAPRFLITYWLRMVVNSFSWFNEFSHRYQLELPLQVPVLKRAVHHVQHQNSQFNQQVAQVLLAAARDENKGERNEKVNPKVELLRQAAAETAHPQTFLNSAAATQRAAARWDHLYRWLPK